MNLVQLWSELQNQPWFQWLPPFLRTSPTLFCIAVGVLAWVLIIIARRLLSRRSARPFGTRAALRAEISELEGQGEWSAVGDRYRALGRNRAALRAYRRAGNSTAAARLLLERGEYRRAREIALEAEAWELYAEICELEGDDIEAGAAFERVSRWHHAASCYRRAGEAHDAARCLIEGGMESEAASLLLETAHASSATLFEVAIRASIDRSRGTPLSREMAQAVSRCAQLLVECDDIERAFDLAVDAGQLDLAVPLARDFLSPTEERANVCVRAGATLAAADIYNKLGDLRNEALLRADYESRHERHLEAADWFEKAGEVEQAAEMYAAGGESRRAAAIYEKLGQLKVAAELYDRIGDHDRHDELIALASIRIADEDSNCTRLEGIDATDGRDGNPALVATRLINDRYRLVKPIGHGGMGVVYRARDELLDRDVAFKVLPARLAESDDLLLGEARAAARLSHPNIVQVFDLGRSTSGFYIVMELVTGGSLSELLADRQLTLRGAVGLGRQVCSALAHAHSRKIVHRDLKPSNLLCSERNQIKLTDFGLARLIEEVSGNVETRPAGTPHYMAPEQIRGEPVDPRTDLYSFGCLMFEVVCGRVPFGGSSTIFDHLHTNPMDPRSVRGDLPAELASIILACLAKDPAQRPTSAADVGRRLVDLSL